MVKRKTLNANRINRHEKKILIIPASFFVITFLAQLFFAGQSAAKNVELQDLLAVKQDIQQQVSRLKYDDLQISSIAYVEEIAKQHGFTSMDGFLLSLDVTVSPPLASATLTR